MADDNKSSAMPTPPTPLAGVDPSPPSDAQSPTTLILNHLKSQGMPATSENVRRALEQNQANPGTIKGLVSDRPSTEAEDKAAMRAAGQGGGRSATPYVPSGTGSADDTTLLAPSTAPPTAPSTSAGGGNSSSSWLVPAILGGLGAGGAGLYGYSRLKGNTPTPTPQVGGAANPAPMAANENPLDAAMRKATETQELPKFGRDPSGKLTVTGPNAGATEPAPTAPETTLPYYTSRDANGKLVVSPQAPPSILSNAGSPSVTSQIMNPKPTSIVRRPTPSNTFTQDLGDFFRALHFR